MEPELQISNEIIGLVAAVLIFLGAVLSFLNGRLKDAESTEARGRVFANAMFVLVVALNAAAAGALALFSSIILPIALYTGAFSIVVGFFVRRSAPIGRWEMAVFSMYVAAYTLAIATTIMMHFVSRIVDVIDRIVTVM